jgi:RNA polymerase sigma-70 factor (ECF subfamily)
LLFWLHRDKSPQDVVELASTPELERRMFERALGRLGAGERAVFVLYEMEGVSGKEIAEIVGCPEATVWRRLHYARQNFRRELESMGAFG